MTAIILKLPIKQQTAVYAPILGYGHLRAGRNFYFGLKKSAKKLHQTGNEKKIELVRSHFNK